MAGSFEKLVKSQDIFISSQQSGDVGASAKQEFNSFFSTSYETRVRSPKPA